MLILLPVLLMFLTALTLLILRIARPNFKSSWWIAALGSLAALASVFSWQVRLPQILALPFWRPQAIFSYSPAWLANGLSWAYSLSLAALAAGIILTSVVRIGIDPLTWAGTLLLTAFGILAVTADNPLTLVLVWAALDLAELVTMLRSTEGESQSESVVIAFAARVAGIGLVLWASTISIATGKPLNFQEIPAGAGIYLLLAAGLRLGVLPLHLPYLQEKVIRRDFGTILRLVSAASSLALLARLPSGATSTPLTPYLLILTAGAASYAGWMWLRSSDELTGRPFWVLGMASLAIAASLRANPIGSVAWGTALILGGGFLFLYSARQRSLLWLPLVTAWGLTALPYSLTAAGWQSETPILSLFVILYLPAQALLAAGFIRHTLHPGESSLESQPRWEQLIYLLGLILLTSMQLMLGFWGWDGALTFGIWWASLVGIALTIGAILLAQKVLVHITPPGNSGRWLDIFRLDQLYSVLSAVYQFVGKVMDTLTSILEGDGGLLWSLLLLALLLSIFSSNTR